MKKPGMSPGSWNEGVGEHVRTRFHLGLKIAGEIAELRDPHRTKKTYFFCRTVFELFETSIQPFDLMSRRHPLSSTRAVRFNQLRKANLPQGSRDVPASSRRQFLEARFTSSS